MHRGTHRGVLGKGGAPQCAAGQCPRLQSSGLAGHLTSSRGAGQAPYSLWQGFHPSAAFEAEE